MVAKGKGKSPMLKSKPQENDVDNNSKVDTDVLGQEETKLEEPLVLPSEEVEEKLNDVEDEEMTNEVDEEEKANEVNDEEKGNELNDDEEGIKVNGEEKTNDEVNDEEKTNEVNNEEKANEINNEEKIDAQPKKAGKLRKRGRRGSKGKDVTKEVKDLESFGKGKSSKKAASMGMVFMCNSKTKKDCYRYKVLGLPASKKELVSKIYKGMRLFLFDIDLKLMYGIYRATGQGGYNIEPKAFNSAFPSQVRFGVLEDCLPLAEEKFKKVIKDNYFAKNKFDTQLNAEQVKNLCKLFNASKNKAKAKASGGSSRAEAPSFRERDRVRSGRRDRRGRDDGRRPPSGRDRPYKPPPVVYGREPYAALPPPLPPVHAPPPPSYAYSYGAADPYRLDPYVEHRDRQHYDRELRHRDEAERRDPIYPLGGYRTYSGGLPSEYQRSAAVPPPSYLPPPALPSDYYHLAPQPAEYHQPTYRY